MDTISVVAETNDRVDSLSYHGHTRNVEVLSGGKEQQKAVCRGGVPRGVIDAIRTPSRQRSVYHIPYIGHRDRLPMECLAFAYTDDVWKDAATIVETCAHEQTAV